MDHIHYNAQMNTKHIRNIARMMFPTIIENGNGTIEFIGSGLRSYFESGQNYR
jgi:hypothetical protein